MNGPYIGSIALTGGTAYSFQANYFQVRPHRLFSHPIHSTAQSSACSPVRMPFPVDTRRRVTPSHLEDFRGRISGVEHEHHFTIPLGSCRVAMAAFGPLLDHVTAPTPSPYLRVVSWIQATGSNGFILTHAAGTPTAAPAPASYFTRTVATPSPSPPPPRPPPPPKKSPPPKPPSPPPPKPPTSAPAPSSATAIIASVKSGQVRVPL